MNPKTKFYNVVEFIYIWKKQIKKMSNEELMVMEFFFNKRLEEMDSIEKKKVEMEQIFFNIFLEKHYD